MDIIQEPSYEKNEYNILKEKTLALIKAINENKTELWDESITRTIDCIILEEEKGFKGIEPQIQDLEEYLNIT